MPLMYFHHTNARVQKRHPYVCRGILISPFPSESSPIALHKNVPQILNPIVLQQGLSHDYQTHDYNHASLKYNLFVVIP